MIETLKRWMEKVKSSSVVKPFLAVKNWFQENVIKRKLVIFSILFAAWISLWLEHSILQNAKPTQMSSLKPKQTFVNGTGEI